MNGDKKISLEESESSVKIQIDNDALVDKY